MYSGTTLKSLRYFDAWFGAHQKIDRIARRHLRELLMGNVAFPKVRDILKFEGLNGPDGIKRKAPGKNEPWHFYDPSNPDDDRLVEVIDLHYRDLVESLLNDDAERAAFEAAWLAHAIVDGLTPAHHYPFEKELVKLRSGQGRETRNSTREKLFMHGDTAMERLYNNWRMWGDRGLLATHFAFEWGIAVMATPLRLNRSRPTESHIEKLSRQQPGVLFKERAERIAAMNMYTAFYKSGWTPKLAKQVRQELLPTIINTVTLVWYRAAMEARERKI